MLPHALILAGGKSSRMRADKTTLPFLGAPTLTHYIFGRLSPHFASVKIAAKADKWGGQLPLIIDSAPVFSPLHIIASLEQLCDGPVFLIAADTPFIRISTIQKLFENLQNNAISLPSSRGKTHNLCGFYTAQAAQAARGRIAIYDRSPSEEAARELLRVSALAKLLPTAITEFSNEAQFTNINTPDELKNALLMAKSSPLFE